MEFHKGFCADTARDLKPNNPEESPPCVMLLMFKQAAVEKCRAWRRDRFGKGVKKGDSGADTAASCPFLANTSPGFNSQARKHRARL